MTYRVPPSLAWLAKRRARTKGELIKARKEHEKLLAEQEKVRQFREKLIRTMERDLEAIDRTLGLHDILVDPELIKAKQPKSAVRVAEYGGLTRGILRHLANCGGKPAGTRDIAVFVAMSLGIDPESSMFRDLKLRVRYRLKDLVRFKRIIRVHEGRGVSEGRWTLLDEDSHVKKQAS